ncbi:hypothetical protein SLS62_004944 [Diatrype stigma]|uniref:Major facilitator superfamily (MFS) profile domain-containing protein n=1 Tax=Diatrype stigma TaxID=117547 RepID=A0AAN9UVJ9_9PEZI
MTMSSMMAKESGIIIEPVPGDSGAASSIEGLDPRTGTGAGAGTGPESEKIEIEGKDPSGYGTPLIDDTGTGTGTTNNNTDVDATPTPTPTSPHPPPPPPPPFTAGPVPDGGWEAWMQVAASFVVMMDTWGLVNSFGVFQTYYETSLLSDHSSSAISWIGSVQGALLLLLGAVSGPLFDAGHFRALMASGTFLVVFGLFMTSLCTAYWQVLLAQGFCIGIGCGLLFLPSAAILSQYFARRRAVALGLQSAGSPLAGIVFPVIFSRLQPVLGFPWATRVIAFVLLALSAVPLVFLRPRAPPPKHHRALFDATALRDRPYMLFNAGGLLAFVGLYVPYFYLQLYAIQHGLLPGGSGGSGGGFDSAYLVTLLNAGSVPGRILPSVFADYFAGSPVVGGSSSAAVAVLAATALGAAVLAFAWLGVRSFGGVVAFALLFGFFNGGVTSLPPSAIAALTPDLRRLGTRMGTSFLFTGTAVLIGTPIAGAVLRGGSGNEESGGDGGGAAWTNLIAYSGATLLGGAALFTAAQMAHVRRLKRIAAAKG